MPGRRFAVTLAAALLVASSAFADFQAAYEAFNAGDYETAYREWLPLAEQGSAAAQFNIGLLYDEGKGREPDMKQAVEWYRRAAENGFPRAQFRLGELHESGQGFLERDLIQARKWFAIAAEGKYRGAKKRMKAVAKSMTPGEIALGDMYAREFLAERKTKG